MTDQESAGNEAIRQQLAEANKEYLTWKAFLDTDQWQTYKEAMSAHVKERRDRYELSSPAGMDGLINNEYLRGEIAGLRLSTEFVEEQLQALADTIEGLKDLLKGGPEEDDG